jgi:hypothetical protein
MKNEDVKNAQRLWNYMLMNHKLEKADIIIGLGSHDIRTADRAVEVYKKGLAPVILFSGGVGSITKAKQAKSEAELYAERSKTLGVDEKRFLLKIDPQIVERISSLVVNF